MPLLNKSELLFNSKEVEVLDVTKVTGEDFHYANCHSFAEYCKNNGYKLIKIKE